MSTQQDLEALKNLDKKENLPGEVPGQGAGFSPDSALSSLTQMETGVNKQVEAGLTPGTSLDSSSVLNKVEGQKLSDDKELEKKNIILQKEVENLNPKEKKAYEDFIKMLINNNISQPRNFFLSHPEYIDVFRQGTPDLDLFVRVDKSLKDLYRTSFEDSINSKKFGDNWKSIEEWEMKQALDKSGTVSEKDQYIANVTKKYLLSASEREKFGSSYAIMKNDFYKIKADLIGGLSLDDFNKYYIEPYISKNNIAGY